MKEDLKLIVPIVVLLMLLAGVVGLAYILPHESSSSSPITTGETTEVASRWRFLDDQSGPEVERKNKTLQQIDSFWRGFIQRSLAFKSPDQAFEDKSFQQWIGQSLGEIDPNFEWEMGRGENGSAELAICMGNSTNSMPIVETMVERAGNIPGWKITSYRLPIDAIDVSNAFEARMGKELPEFRFDLEQTEGHGINVTISSPKFVGDDRKEDLETAFILTEIVLGEDNLNRWVSSVSSKHAEPKAAVAFNCGTNSEQLKNDFETKKKKILATLPSEPYSTAKPKNGWAVIHFTEDYLKRNENLARLRFTFLTPWIPLGQTFFGDEHFFSIKWSKFGEHFAYLETISNQGEIPADKREKFEDALNKLLKENKAGCLVATGRGRPETYYYDLALTDPDKAIPLLRHFCKEQKMSKETWLRFHDYYWRYEWVRMLRDTPDLKSPELPG